MRGAVSVGVVDCIADHRRGAATTYYEMEAGDDENEAAGKLSIRDQTTISFVGNLVDTGVSFAGLIVFAYVLGTGGPGKFYFILAVVGVSAICYVGALVVVDVRFRHIVRDLLLEVNVSYA